MDRGSLHLIQPQDHLIRLLDTDYTILPGISVPSYRIGKGRCNGVRSHIFTEIEKKRLTEWMENRNLEDPQTRKIFVEIRRNISQLKSDVNLLSIVSKRLSAEGRLTGRPRLRKRLKWSLASVKLAQDPSRAGETTPAILKNTDPAVVTE